MQVDDVGAWIEVFEDRILELQELDVGSGLVEAARRASRRLDALNFTTSDPACSTLATRPQLLTGGACTSCVSWNSSVAGMQELCAVQIPGSPVMYANVTACVVPVFKRSWGAMKLLYR